MRACARASARIFTAAMKMPRMQRIRKPNLEQNGNAILLRENVWKPKNPTNCKPHTERKEREKSYMPNTLYIPTNTDSKSPLHKVSFGVIGHIPFAKLTCSVKPKTASLSTDSSCYLHDRDVRVYDHALHDHAKHRHHENGRAPSRAMRTRMGG